MPDIGLLELILIGVVAFLVLGPEKMPEFFSQIGGVVKQGRQWVSSMRYQIEQETELLKRPAEEVRDALSDGLSSMPDPVKEVQQEIQDATQPADKKE